MTGQSPGAISPDALTAYLCFLVEHHERIRRFNFIERALGQTGSAQTVVLVERITTGVDSTRAPRAPWSDKRI